MLGGYCEGVTPVPFPNTEVKPFCADDTTPLRRGKVGRRQAFFIKLQDAGFPRRLFLFAG